MIPKTLEECKTEKLWWENHSITKKTEYELAKKYVKKAEADLKECRKIKARLQRELKFAQQQAIKLDRKIKTTPGRVRKWGREHPGELINTLERKI